MDQPEEALECRTCREPIRPGARKCIRCDSYQDWRRFLSVSSSTLALLIALISVATASAPTLKRLIVGERSDLNIAYQATVTEGMMFLVENSGTRPGVIVGAGIGHRPDFLDASIRPEGERSWHIVKPGEVKSFLVEVKVVGAPAGVYADFMRSEAQPVQIFVDEFGGGRDRPHNFNVPRSDLFPIVLKGKDRIRCEEALKTAPEWLMKRMKERDPAGNPCTPSA